MNKAKIVECDVKELQGRQEQFKRKRFDSGAGFHFIEARENDCGGV